MKLSGEGKKVKLKGQKSKNAKFVKKKHIHTPKGHIFKEKNMKKILVTIKKRVFLRLKCNHDPRLCHREGGGIEKGEERNREGGGMGKE